MSIDTLVPKSQAASPSITLILAAPGVLVGGIWCLLAIGHIAKPIGYAALLLALVSWPILIPASIICSLIGLFYVRKECSTARRYCMIAVHLIILGAATVALHGMIQEIRSGGPFFSAGNG